MMCGDTAFLFQHSLWKKARHWEWGIAGNIYAISWTASIFYLHPCGLRNFQNAFPFMPLEFPNSQLPIRSNFPFFLQILLNNQQLYAQFGSDLMPNYFK